MKLGLGTVQFGLNYGVSNGSGKVADEEIQRILSLAQEHQISVLDTAQLYGESEQTLGNHQLEKFNLVTKLGEISHANGVKPAFNLSLQRLNQSNIYGLLFHQPEILFTSNGEAIFAEFIKLKKTGKVHRIGVSVYSPEEAFTLAKKYPLDIIQLPLNLLDQRFITSGCIRMLKQHGIEIHARSIFLQGLLLMAESQRPAFFARWRTQLNHLAETANNHQIPLLALALSIGQATSVDKLIVGCTSRQELMQIIQAYQVSKQTLVDHSALAVEDDQLILPMNWPLRGN